MTALGTLGLLALLAWTPTSTDTAGRADAVDDPLAPLHAWDADRAAAFASQEPARVRELYAVGSTAAAADVDLMRTYRRHGIRVTGMRAQQFAVRVLERSPDAVRLRVLDRLVATGDDGSRCIRLRAVAPATHVLSLRRDGTRWLMVSVEEIRPDRAARSR